MCCCGQPNVNGQPGYRWQPNDTPRVRRVDPPALRDDDQLIFDEPGRCGGLDSHSHHYRLVLSSGMAELLVRHGGGDERIRLGAGTRPLLRALATLDSNARYWVLNAMYRAYSEGRTTSANRVEGKWKLAAAEKRIKTRKQRGAECVRVWIEERKPISE